MSSTSKQIKDEDQRRENISDSAAMQAANVNEDGSVTDFGAQNALGRLHNKANVAANDRPADDDSVGTPAWFEETSPDNMHSDGGSTLHYEEQPHMDEILAKDEVRDATTVRSTKDSGDKDDTGSRSSSKTNS